MTTWTTIDESPAVMAVKEAIKAMGEIEGFPVKINLLDYVSGQTMPLDNIYRELRSRGVPPSEVFGEAFARRLYDTLFDIYNGRNRKSGLDTFAVAVGFEYLIRWFNKLDTTGVPNSEGDYPIFSPVVNYDLCISPIPEILPDHIYVEAVSTWVRWLVPHFPHSTVTVCTNEIIDFEMSVHGSIVDYQEAVAM